MGVFRSRRKALDSESQFLFIPLQGKSLNDNLIARKHSQETMHDDERPVGLVAVGGNQLVILQRNWNYGACGRQMACTDAAVCVEDVCVYSHSGEGWSEQAELRPSVISESRPGASVTRILEHVRLRVDQDSEKIPDGG